MTSWSKTWLKNNKTMLMMLHHIRIVTAITVGQSGNQIIILILLLIYWAGWRRWSYIRLSAASDADVFRFKCFPSDGVLLCLGWNVKAVRNIHGIHGQGTILFHSFEIPPSKMMSLPEKWSQWKLGLFCKCVCVSFKYIIYVNHREFPYP